MGLIEEQSVELHSQEFETKHNVTQICQNDVIVQNEYFVEQSYPRSTVAGAVISMYFLYSGVPLPDNMFLQDSHDPRVWYIHSHLPQTHDLPKWTNVLNKKKPTGIVLSEGQCNHS